MEQTTNIAGAVRSYLKDMKALNRLSDFKCEYDEAAITAAVSMALRTINFKYQPKTVYTISTCPQYILILGVAVQLLTSEIILKPPSSNVLFSSTTSLIYGSVTSVNSKYSKSNCGDSVI